jgi:hypothetical protein
MVGPDEESGVTVAARSLGCRPPEDRPIGRVPRNEQSADLSRPLCGEWPQSKRQAAQTQSDWKS